MIDTRSITQKTVLVTGCGKNSLGSAVALKFAQSNFRVIATNLTLADMTELDKVPNLIKLEMDVTNAVQVNQVIGEIKEKVGNIDMVINCAGVYYSDFILNADEGILDMLFNVNFKGTFNVCKVVVPMMITQGSGTVVNLASDTSMLSSRYASIFNSIELGLKQMVKNFKLEVTGFNLDWILVQPRRIKSNFIPNQLKSVESVPPSSDPFNFNTSIILPQPDTSTFMTPTQFADELLIQVLKRTDIKYQYYYFLTNPINLIIYAIFFALCYFFPTLAPIWNFFKTNYWYLPNEIVIGEGWLSQLGTFLFGILPNNLQLLWTWIDWGLHNLNYGNFGNQLDKTGVKMKEFS